MASPVFGGARAASCCVLLSLSIQIGPARAADRSTSAATERTGPGARVEGALELAGDLRPSEAADLAFKIAGQLMAVKVERGMSVKKGQLLAALADAEARAQLAQTEAAVAQAEAAVAQSGAQLALARDNETRAASLVAANAAPGSQGIQVRLQAETAQAAQLQAKAALLQAQAARDLALATLVNHQLRAPFDGEIVRVPDGLGQIVAPGTALFRLESLDRLVLRATVSEAELERLRVGDEVTIEANNGAKVTGKVKVVLRSLEAQSRRAPIEVSVPNKERVLVAGSYVRATVKPH